MPSSASAFAVERLSVSFGKTPVLNGLTLAAATGELTAILGPNGAGKTTLLRCATGLLTPQSGTISVLDDQPGSAGNSARVGLMPQSAGAWAGVRAVELLKYLATLYDNPLSVAPLVARLGIGAFGSKQYRRLSGGQQQAVNLAGALIGRPELVFLDEPTAGMDPHARRTTWQLLSELHAAGVTVVLTTHAMDEAEHLADHVFIVDHGCVQISGTVAELTASGDSLEEIFLTHTEPRAA